jgi:asparagine synthetase B (glutamine-hydrolysing)
MSDFLFQSQEQKTNKLSNLIKSIYPDNPPKVFQFHGCWGSLAVSRNPYFGFDPIETETHIYFVIGGPVLTFTDNNFLTGSDPQKGTKKIVERFNQNKLTWDNDLSGPFVFGVIDKKKEKLQIVSDIISFIPVFKNEANNKLALSTHPDILAQITNKNDEKDKTSIADFILNGIVTFPYTFYKSIRQINPASIYTFNLLNYKIDSDNEYYWQSTDEVQRTNIEETANELRNDLKTYIKLVTQGMDEVASFISGGEDSRAVLAMMPDDLKKDTYIFLDEMNREGEYAQKAASAFNANFNLVKRSKFHYIDILENASNLVGSGAEYVHGHSFNIYKKVNLDEYPAVFGGFFSDTFLKGLNIKKKKYTGKLPFVPEIRDSEFNEINKNKSSDIINESIVKKITQRRKEHYSRIKEIRSTSINEWFNLWPITMATETPNIHFNRRLFKSYEPFLSNEVVKISASIPYKWKMNRLLFHKIVKPSFRKCKDLKHASGWHPYYGWQINSCLKFKNIMENKIKRKLNLKDKNHGPWGDWNLIMKSENWKDKKEEFFKTISLLDDVFNNDLENIFNSSKLSRLQKIDLLQASYIIKHF